MGRMVLKLALLVTLLWCALIAGVHAQPYDDAELRALLLPPDGCAAPCWHGIRPGVTSMARAALLLEQTHSIDYDIYPGAIQGEGFINWRTFDRSVTGSIRFIRGTVVNVELEGILLLDVWFLLGDPDMGQYLETDAYRDGKLVGALPFIHSIYYTAYGISAVADTDCLRFWQQLAHVVISADEPPVHIAGSPPSLASYRRTACEQTLVVRGTVRADG